MPSAPRSKPWPPTTASPPPMPPLPMLQLRSSSTQLRSPVPTSSTTGVLIIHGLDGFVSHLSALSCDIDRTTTLSFPQPSSPHLSVMRPMLKEAILRLRVSGYGVLALALRMKFKQLSELKAMTVFALDDVSVFSGGGHATFLSDFWFHVVPNRRMM